MYGMLPGIAPSENPEPTVTIDALPTSRRDPSRKVRAADGGFCADMAFDTARRQSIVPLACTAMSLSNSSAEADMVGRVESGGI